MKVRVIGKTVICNEELIAELNSNTPEQLILYCARVSNPNNQASGKSRLIKYCIDNKHVSIFEMTDLIVEIETSRMISPQILRHWSFSFQEFSQRYAAVDDTGIEVYAARRQDSKNRQNSVDDLPEKVKEEWILIQNENWRRAFSYYKWAIDNGIAKECARAVLPLQTKTIMYMKGNARDWINYLTVRTEEGSQKEHRDIANEIKKIFINEFPVIAKALVWQ